MRSAQSFRDECVQAGYVGPDFHPRHVEPSPALDVADPGVRALGRHLGSAWSVHRLKAGIRAEFGRKRSGRGALNEHDQFDCLTYAWESICMVWLPSEARSGRRVRLGNAVAHGLGRARREAATLLGERPSLLAGDDFRRAVDDRSPAASARYGWSGMNDRYYRLPADDNVIRHGEWDDFQAVLARLPVVQREALAGRLMGRPQKRTAQILGVDVRTVQRAEQDVAHIVRAQDWEESSLEGLPVLVIPYEKPQ